MSMPVVNNLHSENRPKRHTSDIRPHKRNKTKRGREKNRRKKTDKVEHKTKSPAPKEAKALELHPWRLKLEIFSKSVTLWTPLQIRSFILGDLNWKFFQVGSPVDTPTDKMR